MPDPQRTEDPTSRPASRPASGRVSSLALGSAVSGLLAYVFFAIVTRAIGSTAAAPVSILWAWWGFAGAFLTFPLQHWITRTCTARGEPTVRAALRRVSLVLVGISLISGLLAFGLRDRLFGGSVGFAAMVAAVALGSALLGVVRGVLTGRGQLGAVGLGLVLENAARCLAALALLLGEVTAPAAYGSALLIGYATAACFPAALLPRAGSPSQATDSPLVFLGGIAGGQLIGQAVLTGGPVLLALADGPPHQVTALFAGLALFRAPYTLALGGVAALTALFTRLVIAGDEPALRRIRNQVWAVTGSGAVLGAGFGWLAGPTILRLVFGDDVRLSGPACAVIAAGSVAAIGNLVLTVLMIARDRTPTLIRTWAGALLPGVLLFALAPGGPLLRSCWTFAVIEASAFVGMLLTERLPRRPAEPEPPHPRGPERTGRSSDAVE